MVDYNMNASIQVYSAVATANPKAVILVVGMLLAASILIFLVYAITRIRHFFVGAAVMTPIGLVAWYSLVTARRGVVENNWVPLEYTVMGILLSLLCIVVGAQIVVGAHLEKKRFYGAFSKRKAKK